MPRTPQTPGLTQANVNSRRPPEFLWPVADSVPVLEPAAVHIWAVSLILSPAQLQSLSALLSPDERARAARFRSPIHQGRYVAGRAVLRQLLGHYLRREPRTLKFRCAAHGKPSLESGDEPLHFNLAHSGDLALVAVSRQGPLGVDVEALRAVPAMGDLVERFFSPQEARRFRDLPEAAKVDCFFRLWTRKEALLKATGEGIGSSLNLVEVAFLPSEPPAFLSLPKSLGRASDWTLFHLSPACGFTGALACPYPGAELLCRTWSPV